MDRIAAGFALAYAALAGAMAPAATQTNGGPPPLAKRPLTVDDLLAFSSSGMSNPLRMERSSPS